jgi:hypothetical protein
LAFHLVFFCATSKFSQWIIQNVRTDHDIIASHAQEAQKLDDAHKGQAQYPRWQQDAYDDNLRTSGFFRESAQDRQIPRYTQHTQHTRDATLLEFLWLEQK